MKLDTSGDEIKIYDFNDLEAFKIGRHLEEEGIAFYEKLLNENTSDTSVQEVVGKLLKEEREHLIVLQDKIEEMTAVDGDGFEEESFEDIVDTKVFSHFETLKGKKDIFHNRNEAIEFGIIIEKIAVDFYKAILKNTENEKGRNAINDLITQEVAHIDSLNKLV